MRTVIFPLGENQSFYEIGRRGENDVTEVLFDYSSWVAEFGSGVCSLLVKRTEDLSAYPVVMTYSGNVARWLVSSIDTAYKGNGQAEYVFTVGGQIAKSIVYDFVVLPDIGNASSTPPDPYEDWVDTLTELGAETLANAQAAERAQGLAETAQTAAETAQGKAEDAQSAAERAQTAAETAQGLAETAEGGAEAQALKAEGFAVGEQDGTAVESGSPYYENNAEYYCGLAAQHASEAGYIGMMIDGSTGHLIYTRTTNVTELDFSLVDGNLILEVG